MTNTQIVLHNQSIARNTKTQSFANPTRTSFKVKPIVYYDGFSDNGIVKRRDSERYGVIRIKPNKVVIFWDDSDKPETYSSLEVAQNWALIESVPWFIVNQTVVVVPQSDGTMTSECRFLVADVTKTKITLVGLDDSDLVQPERTAKYQIAQFPGFPIRNRVEIKPKPVLPVPARFKLKLKASVKLASLQLIDAIGRETELYTEFRKDFANLSSVEEDFTLAWKEVWETHLVKTATTFGHGGKKIGNFVWTGDRFEQITGFDPETFDFITDAGKRIHLLKLYLYPLLEIAKPIPSVCILKAGDRLEVRVGFENKQKARKQEVLIRRLSGCKEINLTDGNVLTGFKHEYVLHNPYSKTETFLKHILNLVNQLPT
jgi:hypothetical protein